jgi:hypothetical protein
MGCHAWAWGQQTPQDTTRADSLQMEIAVDSLAADTLSSEVEADSVIHSWKYRSWLGSNRALSDSLLRWEIWGSLADRWARQPGAVTYRLGGLGREDAVWIHGYAPQNQQLRWEGISLSDPMVGTFNWHDVPHHQVLGVDQRGNSAKFQTDFSTQRYYLNKPLSRLNYEESSQRYRQLEFAIAENINRTTNVTLSYWDRRDGERYPQFNMTGRQLWGEVHHLLTDRSAVRIGFLNNKREQQESFGYVFSDPALFSFDRFEAIPNAQANSTRSNTTIRADYFWRPDTLSPNRFQATMYRQSMERKFTATDTIRTNYGRWGALMRYQKSVGALHFEAQLNSHFTRVARAEHSVNPDATWWNHSAEAEISYQLFDNLALSVGGKGQYSTQDLFPELRTQISWQPGNWKLGVWGYGAQLSRPRWMKQWIGVRPANQQKKLIATGVGGSISIPLGDYMTVGGRTHFRLSRNQWAFQDDSSFVQLPEMLHQSHSVYARLNSDHVESEISLTTRDIQPWEEETIPAVRVADGGLQMVLKGAVHWKGYVLHKAAFIKGGIAGSWIPIGYKAPYYRPEYQYWQWNHDQSAVPGHYRLDVDLSARVRSIIVLMRYENVLDGFGQAGYFETIPYPMPARRFMVGFRVVFNN